VNDPRFLQLTKAFSMLGGEVLSNTKKEKIASGLLVRFHPWVLPICMKKQKEKRGGGGKEDLDSIKATYLPISNLPISFVATLLFLLL
jgi:hypothetical protein